MKRLKNLIDRKVVRDLIIAGSFLGLLVVFSISAIQIGDLSRKFSSLSKAATIGSIAFSPQNLTTNLNQEYTVNLDVNVSEAITIQGYTALVNFDKAKVSITGINYLAGGSSGNVSIGLGDDQNSLTAVNNAGVIKVFGEIQSVGADIPANQTTTLASIKFKVLDTTNSIIAFLAPNNTGPRLYKVVNNVIQSVNLTMGGPLTLTKITPIPTTTVVPTTTIIPTTTRIPTTTTLVPTTTAVPTTTLPVTTTVRTTSSIPVTTTIRTTTTAPVTTTPAATTTIVPATTTLVPTTTVAVCQCNTNNLCTNVCTFSKDPSATYPSQFSCTRESAIGPTPSNSTKDSYCLRNLRGLGDADGNGKVDDLDYFYYVRSVNGGVIPESINPDFDGNGYITPADRKIVIKNLQ